MEENQIKIKADRKNVVIEIPVDLLLFTQENREDLPLRVTNIDKMLDWVLDMFLDFGDEEDGSTAFTRFIDNMFVDAYESGNDWLEGIIYEDDFDTE